MWFKKIAFHHALKVKNLPLFIVLTGLIMTGCNAEYDRQLRGKWQLRTLTTTTGQKSIDTVFYNFDNQVFVMQCLVKDGYSETVWGEFKQTGDSIHLNFPDTVYASPGKLKLFFGWETKSRIYYISELSSGRLCLKDGTQTMEFRRY